MLKEIILNCNRKVREMKMCLGIHIVSWTRVSDSIEVSFFPRIEFRSIEFQLDFRGLHSQLQAKGDGNEDVFGHPYS